MSTNTFLTQCTHCQKKIKLSDRSVIGKSAKCPACQQKFVIAEWLHSQSEEAKPEQFEKGNQPKEPEAPTSKPVTAKSAPPKSPPVNKIDKPSFKTSKSSEPSSLFPAANQFDFENQFADEPTSTSSSDDTAFPDFSKGKSVPATNKQSSGGSSNQDDFPFHEFKSADDPIASTVTKKPKSKASMIMLGLSMFIIFGGGVWYLTQMMGRNPEEKKKKAVVVTKEYKQHILEKVDQYKLVQELVPTKGEKLNTHLLPAGVRVVVYLRVGEIFGDKPEWKEFRAAMGPFTEWLKGQIESYSHFKVEEIDTVKFGIILGARGTVPEVATVVHLKQAINLSETLIRFNVAPLPEQGIDAYGNEKFAFIKADNQTIAFSPPSLISDLVSFKQQDTISTDGLTELISKAKNDSHVLIAFENDDLEQQIPYIFSQNLQPAMTTLAEWFGKDVETTLCSFQLNDPFFAELIVRNRAASKPSAVERTVKSNLNQLPSQILQLTKLMRPSQKGYQQLIGRLPAMLKVLSMCTVSGSDKQAVHFVTVMPLKAAPNLAAATLLAWDESTRTTVLVADNSPKTPTVGTPKKKLPDSMADRMKFKIDVEFNRVPLQDAFAFIASEIEVKLEIDGDALKMGGYTKNMPQTFTQKQISVEEICKKIVSQYNQSEIMCIAIDEKAKTLYLFTESAAKAKGIPVYK